jgi:hypothetical protein
MEPQEAHNALLNSPEVMALITALVPLVIAGAKAAAARIPTWVLPIAAPLIGAGLDIAAHYIGLTEGTQPIFAAIFGMAGTGLREIVDQLRKTAAGSRNGGYPGG